MKPSEVLLKHRETIRKLVHSSGMTNPRVFGSAIHGDDTEESDLDLLIDAPPRASILDLAKLQVAIEAQIGISIDLLTSDSLPPKFRDSVLAEALPV
jgi:predicted nucleotidyltransferase